MKKQIICAALSALCVMGGATAMAEVTPKVVVDGYEIVFEDQQPIIEEDRILVPLRGVLEGAGGIVHWYPDSQKVQIQSYNGWKIAEFIIDSKTMITSEIKQDLLSADKKEVELDVPARLVNDRTLIPLKAVSDAFDYETTWDDETKTAYVKTDRPFAVAGTDPTVYLSADTEDVSTGDTFDVIVNIKDFKNEKGWLINGATIGLIYDKTKFKFISGDLFSGDKKITAVGASNDNFSEDSLKTVGVSIDYDNCLNTDGMFYKLTFEALSDEGGDFVLSNRYNSRLQQDTTVLMSIYVNDGDIKAETMTRRDFFLDETPLVLK